MSNDRIKQTESRRKRFAEKASADVNDAKKQLLDENQVFTNLLKDTQPNVEEAEEKALKLEYGVKCERAKYEEETSMLKLQLEEMIDQRTSEQTREGRLNGTDY